MLADLSRYPLAELIRRVSVDQLSGDLEVRDGRVAKTVYFDRGRVVFAASNVDGDRLGDLLVSIGRITPEDYERVSKLMKGGKTPMRFGDALVVAGLMDRNELGRSLARQVRAIVRSLFALESGAASFAERKTTIPVEYMVGVSVHRMLYAGIRSMTSPRLLRLGLGKLDRQVRRTEAPPFRFAVYKCPAEELEILDRCRKPHAVRELVAHEKRMSVERVRSVYALLASGVLEDADPEQAAAARPVPHPETGTFLLAVAEPTPSSRTEAVRLEVRQELEFSEQLDPGAWARATDPAELARALEEKISRLCRLHDGIGDDAELRRDLEVVLGRTTFALHRARQISAARNAMARATEDARAGAVSEAPSAAAPTPAPAIPPSSQPVRSPAPPQRDGATRDGVPAPAVAPEAKPGPRPAAGKPAGGSGTRPRAAPPARVAAPPAAAGPAPPASPAPPPATTIPVSSPSVSSTDTDPSVPVPAAVAAADAHERKQRSLLLTAELRLRVRDHAGAIEAYRELTALAPDVSEFRLRLARTMTAWAPTLRQAEREFLEAVRLDPGNAQAHYEFARFYERLKFRGRALAELRTALQSDPGHAEARALLARLSPREAAAAPGPFEP